MTMFNFRSPVLAPVAACVCAIFAVSAQAQVMDELEIRQDGNNAIVEIRFVTPIQYSRALIARSGDQVQVFYRVLPRRETISLDASERRLPGGGEIPSFIVRDVSAADALPTSVNRKLVVRLGAFAKFRVRAGRTNRSIELVLTGLGGSVPAAVAASVKTRPAIATVDTTVTPTSQANADVEAQAAALLATAQSAYDGGNYDAATTSLNQLLNLPPNQSSRRAQELAGLARLNAGDKARAAAEFDVFLKLYPQGADSDRVRQLLTSLPAPGQSAQEPVKEAAAATSVTTGSVSMFYYGGASDTRTQEFQDSPLGGLPILQSETNLSATDQKQLQTNVDLNWRYRDTEKDMRFVFRDALTRDYLKGTDKNRLNALYFDYRSLTLGGNVRVGRQSPTGGGVMSRFDGVQAGYAFQPKWKVNAVVGKPTDDLLDTRRMFYGVSVDAEALTKSLSGSLYLIENRIDGTTDRRGLGTELRYFSGPVSVSGQFDYDTVLRAVNIAAVQGNWQFTEATAVNAMLDRRITPMVALGNVLFFQDPTLSQAKRIDELLGVTPIETLQDQAKAITAYQNQFRVGGTHTLSTNWQTGADFSLTSIDAVKPVASLSYPGQAATGNLWGVSAQLIGTNLYSARDTHVFNVSLLGGPSYHGTLLSYNNLSSLGDKWQLEPSLKYYTQSSPDGGANDIWTLGLRATYRVRNQLSLESELTYERSDARGATTVAGPGALSSAARTNYYFGARYEF
ncbi:MAG: hypothetical protein AUK51_06995 [Comamonadaceae bacterium CG2_30_59_20]|nr:MAG: hypothetical protein AUK51_06995 [Comamonadaceae bacterium CG2_30_59_20]